MDKKYIIKVELKDIDANEAIQKLIKDISDDNLLEGEIPNIPTKMIRDIFTTTHGGS